jgi:hypothetical protein
MATGRARHARSPGTVNALTFDRTPRDSDRSGDWTARPGTPPRAGRLATLDHTAPVLAVALDSRKELILTGGQTGRLNLGVQHGRPIGPRSRRVRDLPCIQPRRQGSRHRSADGLVQL